jgi:hypothetical protein
VTVGDPRPTRRIADQNAGYEKLRREGRCRACGVKGYDKLNRAHLVPKGQRGDDLDCNIVPLCGSGTSGCHGALTDHHVATSPSLLYGAEWTVVAAALRARLLPEEHRYIVSKKGEDWLNRAYPS